MAENSPSEFILLKYERILHALQKTRDVFSKTEPSRKLVNVCELSVQLEQQGVSANYILSFILAKKKKKKMTESMYAWF